MKALLLFIIALLSRLIAQAHGEDKPGPHGGSIKMPANFHTELVADKDGSFHIYLIDLQFQNSTVKNSELKVFVLSNKKRTNLKCEVVTDHFHCKAGKPIKSGVLTIKAKRDGSQASMEAKYNLPLKEFDISGTPSVPVTEDHSKHN